MSRAYVPLLLLLSAFWGASFMFIKVADRVFEPWTLMAGRLLVAAAVIVPFVAAQVGARHLAHELRRLWLPALVLGVASAALPFTLIAWGEKHVDSGVAAIGNASMPIWVALLALRFIREERVSGLRLVGVLVAIVGVAVLVGVHPRGGWWGVVGTVAVVLAAVSYAASLLYSQRVVDRTDATVLTTASIVAATLVLLPVGAARLPGHVPNWKELGSVIALGVLGTAIGQLIYFRMMAAFGSARTSLVTYLLPVTALFYGVTLLGEPLTVEEVVGLVLILGGVALGAGLVRVQREEPAAAAP